MNQDVRAANKSGPCEFRWIATIFLGLAVKCLLCSGNYVTPFVTREESIIDAEGKQVKLQCVNWPSHMDTYLPEGLQYQNVDYIVENGIVANGFNCVRLTYSIDLALSTNASSPAYSMTARSSLTKLNLMSALVGFSKNNPSLIDSPVIASFDAVVSSLDSYKILILLDNHVSRAIWCCNANDGNGWWGSKYFDFKLWIQGLTFMANRYKDVPHVFAQDLRNELRDSLNLTEWNYYMAAGAVAIHNTNPKSLILVSGLVYSGDLTWIAIDPFSNHVPAPLHNKIVYEAHLYPWDFPEWLTRDAAFVAIDALWGFIPKLKLAPVLLSEFGFDVASFDPTNRNPNSFTNYISEYLRLRKVGSMWWVLAGSYYVREGNPDSDEGFGVLEHDWSKPRNSKLLTYLKNTSSWSTSIAAAASRQQ